MQTMFSRPLYLVTGDMPVPTTAMPRSVATKMTELRGHLQALLWEAQQIESDLLQLAVEGTLREYGEVWLGIVKESTSTTVLDVLTRSALTSLPVQVSTPEEFDLLLRKHTTINLDAVKAMTESFERLAAR